MWRKLNALDEAHELSLPVDETPGAPLLPPVVLWTDLRGLRKAIPALIDRRECPGHFHGEEKMRRDEKEIGKQETKPPGEVRLLPAIRKTLGAQHCQRFPGLDAVRAAEKREEIVRVVDRGWP